MEGMAHPFAGEPAAPADTDAEWELIEDARDDVHAGRVIHDEDVDAWLDLLVRGGLLPMPAAPGAEWRRPASSRRKLTVALGAARPVGLLWRRNRGSGRWGARALRCIRGRNSAVVEVVPQAAHTATPTASAKLRGSTAAARLARS